MSTLFHYPGWPQCLWLYKLVCLLWILITWALNLGVFKKRSFPLLNNNKQFNTVFSNLSATPSLSKASLWWLYLNYGWAGLQCALYRSEVSIKQFNSTSWCEEKMKTEREKGREGGRGAETETETEKGKNKKIIANNLWAQPFCQQLLRASCRLTHSIFTATLWNSYYYYLHFFLMRKLRHDE